MAILYLHGLSSRPGGTKPTFLKSHGFDVINPGLPDDDFTASVRIAQEAYASRNPDVVVGSSRGGAVAMNLDTGTTPLVLVAPAWKRWGSATTVKSATVIIHSEHDAVVPLAQSRTLISASGLPDSALIVVGRDHNMVDDQALGALLAEVKRAARSAAESVSRGETR
jgi:fermentation-respiration switch protein FrsA (DUF1100 family)